MTSDRTFLAVSALSFAASSALTIVWCASMQTMGGMPMPGGWTMSMTWMRMPGRSWPGSAASFLAMWTIMMVAMMLPSLMPMLLHYRAAVAVTGVRLGVLTSLATAGYFFVWAVAGVATFAAGVMLAAIEMQSAAVSRAVPIAGAVIVTIAGLLQFTSWKARHLSRCREMRHDVLPPAASAALRHGIQLGLRCVCCCANLTAILLVIGVMDLRAMAFVTAAITGERLFPFGAHVARATGALFVVASVILIVRS